MEQTTTTSGHQDVYVHSMWEAAGQRVSGARAISQGRAAAHPAALYQRPHARKRTVSKQRATALENVGQQAGVEMGRWSWSSDFWDFDHDGYPDLYVANGYLSGAERDDLASFFWRQIVAKSSEDATPASAYERGWNAIKQCPGLTAPGTATHET